MSCAGAAVAIDVVGVVVPARNEADRIGAAIGALSVATATIASDVRVEITVVDDGSSDGTGGVARSALADLGTPARLIRVGVGRVGAARRLGIEAMTARWGEPHRAWILSTDADSRVRPDWIRRHLEHAAAGAAAVAGVVDLLPDESSSGFRDRWRADYGVTLSADGDHPHAHAANLGVRLDAYRRAGGFRDLDRAEDIDLWRRLRLVGYRPVADAGLVVDTSGRRHGRVARGFAHALATAVGDIAPSAGDVAERIA